MLYSILNGAMTMPKLRKEDYIYGNSGYSEVDYDEDWNIGPIQEYDLEKLRVTMCKEKGIDPKRVRLDWCAPVGEYCIYVDNKWSGYLEF